MHITAHPIKSAICGILAAASLLAAPAVLHAQVRADNARTTGTLRITGEANLQPLLTQLQAGFGKKNASLHFANQLKGDAAAIYGLETRTSDLALMSRPIHPFERYGTYERSWIFPVEIQVATGSATSATHAGAYVIVVHKDNPLRGVSLQQLDRMFGESRGGGWKGLEWHETAALKSADVLRTWGQAGVDGSLAGKRINTYGPPLQGAGVVTDFQSRVMHGGSSWSETYREYADSKAMLAALSNDPQGIGYTTRDQIGDAAVKVLPVSAVDGTEFVSPDAAAVASRRYPLYRPVYLYYTIDTHSGDHGQADPKVLEFVRYLLGPEGQAIVAKSGAQFRLPPGVLRDQLAKLEDTSWPAERPRP